MGEIEKRLETLGIELPEMPTPIGNYMLARRHGDLVYTSGLGSRNLIGQVGDNVTVEQAYAAARQVALQCLACIQAELGTLDKVAKVFKVLGFVNSAPGFSEQPAVMNGCSDLLVEVFGDKGKHARSAIGTSNLPEGIAVEIEMLVAVEQSS